MTGGKGTPFLPSSSLTRSPLHRPGSADMLFVSDLNDLDIMIESDLYMMCF